jgi:hypothetical protein
MGIGICRFAEKTGCYESGSRHYRIFLKDKNIILNVPELWEHYMMKHSVQPTEEEKRFVMDAHLEDIRKPFWPDGSPPDLKEVQILYVEKKRNGYTHKTGGEVDTEFKRKLEALLRKGETVYTKGT